MTRRQRTGLITATLAAGAIALVGGLLYLHGAAAPEVARLLPEADTILYFNLRPVRLLTNLGEKQFSHEPEYEDFVHQTGFQFEHDLDEGAFAIHHSSASPDGAASEDSARYSEVFTGRFDSAKVAAYLQKLSASTERYRAHDIYSIPHESRMVRVSILTSDMVAISNTRDPATIHHIIDQYERSAWPLGGPSLLARYYHEVPTGSLAWLISDAPHPEKPALPELSLSQLVSQFLGNGAIVCSVRYTTAIHLRTDSFVSGEQASHLAGQLNTTLDLLRDFDKGTQPSAPDPDLKAAIDSIRIEQGRDRVSITATLPPALLTKLFESSISGEEAAPTPGPAKKETRPKENPPRHRPRRTQ